MARPEIGAKLREARTLQDLSLEDITAQTKIPVRFLEAIEAGNLDELPGLIFARNFVAQYSRSLGLNSDELLRELPKIDEVAMPMPTAPLKARRSAYLQENSFVSSAAWLFLGVLAVAGAYVYFNGVRLTKAASGLAPAAEKPVQAISHAAPAQTEERIASVAAQPASTVTPQPAQSAPAEKPVAGTGAVLVTVSATAPSWVSLTADGKVAYTGTLAPNEKKEVSADKLVKLVAGNAGGLSVFLNGKALDPLGPAGEVRVLRLTAEGPEFLPRASAQQPRQAGADPL